jgi:putative ATP-dependent endonuclease of the OLD family
MAAKKAAAVEAVVPAPLGELEQQAEPRARLHKITIRNFRAIGPEGVTIELDRIVILVGPNNVGKSTILRAYQLVTFDGTKEAKLGISEFPNEKVEAENLPEIELEIVVKGSLPGAEWISTRDGENFVREKFVWEGADKPPVRRGFKVTEDRWADKNDKEKVPWGAANVAKAGRPRAHRIDAFANPDAQTDQIIDLLSIAIENRIKKLTSVEDDSERAKNYRQLLGTLAELRKGIVEDTKDELAKLETQLSEQLSDIFPGHRVTLDPGIDRSPVMALINKKEMELRMGHVDGHKSPVALQGSGARRALLWTTLQLIAEDESKRAEQKKKPKAGDDEDAEQAHVLLIDEPEICLHPSAARRACQALYKLAETGSWQVMATTHSPLFIDVSKEHTTIVRVARSGGQISGTTVFRPERAQFDATDRENIKLLNLFDPYVAEFFFDGQTIIVEGDTEYTVFKQVIAGSPSAYPNVHIIRARGKAIIVSLLKILNQFKSSYSVLHDSDTPERADGNTNTAWTENTKILSEYNNRPRDIPARLLASKKNFEAAFLGTEVSRDKPYRAWQAIRDDAKAFATVRQLLDCLVDFTKAPPTEAIEWKDIEVLKASVPERP